MRRNSSGRIAFILSVVGSLVAVDQLSKVAIRAWVERTDAYEFLWGSFILQHAENPGAFLSLGSSLGTDARFSVFTLAVAAFLIYAAWELARKPEMPRLHTAGLSLLIGGGIGNLIDRSLYGTVTDFLNVGLGPVRTGVFNVADMAIMAGVAALIFGGRQGSPSVNKSR